MMPFRRPVPRAWVGAFATIAAATTASAYLVREQWRVEIAAAEERAQVATHQLAERLSGELARGQYERLPDLLRTWAATDPSLARLRLVAATGFPLAEFERPELHGAQFEHSTAVPYGVRGEARLTVVTDLGLAHQRQARLQTELVLANVLLSAAVVALTLMYGAARASARRYRMLSAANQPLLTHAASSDLLQTVCDVAAREGGYALAWIAVPEDAPFVRIAAAAGPASAYLEGLRLSADRALAEGQGPVGHTLRTGEAYVCNDFLRDPMTAPWAPRARRFGIRSGVALPLRRGSTVTGVLCIYSERRNRFDVNEGALLEQLAGDISLGLDYAARGADLKRSLAQLNEIELTAGAGAFALALPARRLWCSDGAARLLGRTAGEGLIPESAGVDAREPAADLVELIAAAADTPGAFELDLQIRAVGQASRWLRVTGIVQRSADGDASATGMLQDISASRELEAEIGEAADRERQRLASELHDNLGQVLTAASLLLEALHRGFSRSSPPAQSDVGRIRELVDESLRLCRSLAHESAPVLRGELGASLERLAATTRAAGVRCRLALDPATATLAGEQALELYRIAQEAVTNALKHGGCGEIEIGLSQRGPMIELAIRDDGTGFLGAEAEATSGLGQRTMRYRAARAGGTVVFRNNAKRGATVLVTVRRLDV
jgi:signal transduction histidine kinase